MMNDYYQNSADAYDFGAGGAGAGGGGGSGGGGAGDPLDGGALADDPHDSYQDGDEVDIRGRPFHSQEVDFDDPKIASLPKILLMGPRRGGKTSIQVRFKTCVVGRAVDYRVWLLSVKIGWAGIFFFFLTFHSAAENCLQDLFFLSRILPSNTTTH